MLNNLKLYDFWSKKITEYLIDDLKDDNFLIDLSSKEYSKIVNFKALDIKVITPDFKTRTDKGLKTIAIWSKRMRGLMTREIIKNRVQTEEDLQNLKIGEYKLEEINNGHYLYIK